MVVQVGFYSTLVEDRLQEQTAIVVELEPLAVVELSLKLFPLVI